MKASRQLSGIIVKLALDGPTAKTVPTLTANGTHAAPRQPRPPRAA